MLVLKQIIHEILKHTSSKKFYLHHMFEDSSIVGGE